MLSIGDECKGLFLRVEALACDLSVDKASVLAVLLLAEVMVGAPRMTELRGWPCL